MMAAATVLASLAFAGSLVFAISRHSATTDGGGAAVPSTVTRNLAVKWAVAEVSRTAAVSCDPAMCRAFRAHGFPADRLRQLRHGAAALLRSSVVVATPAVRSLFGGRLNSVYAPGVIASFGSGSARIDIRAIAVHGAAAYWSALGADISLRKQLGSLLLNSPRVTASGTASKQISNQQVDSRLLITIADMAAREPLYIAGFGDSAPGAGAGSPLRSAELASGDGPSHLTNVAYVRSMFAYLRGTSMPYPPTRVERTRLAGGLPALSIKFAAPSPLGLPRVGAPP